MVYPYRQDGDGGVIDTTRPEFAKYFKGFINVGYGTSTIEQIRQVVREELNKALHPEESGPSATVDYTQNGKHWRGKVYLVEDEDEED